MHVCDLREAPSSLNLAVDSPTDFVVFVREVLAWETEKKKY